MFDLSYVSTATRAAALTPLPVTEVSFDGTFFIVKFDGSVFPVEVLSGGRKVNARLAVVAEDVTRASDFFPLSFDVSGSVSVGCVQTGKRSVEMLGRAVPLPMQPVSEMGFYYATSAEGLLSAPIKVVATTGDETGSYGCILNRLKYEQTYYYRSYLVRGGEIVYGETKSFTVPRPHIYQEPVDLGLSVKWASCNLGATVPEEYGDYYSWGELEPYYESLSPLIWKPGKSYGYYFRSSSFAFYNPRLRHEIEITKYNFDPEFGAVDNKYDLEPEDDVAVEELGGGWRIPTIEEVRELVDNCTWTWTNVNGVKGRMVSGNGNSIFLPAAGVIESLEWEELYWRDNPGEVGRYWSTKMLDYRDPDEIRCLYLEETDYRASTTGRFFGVPVRPVKE